MNKPSSELIALADNIKDGHLAIVHCHPEGLGAVDASQEQRDAIEKALRTAANQSGSERAGVDALREALEFGIWAVSGPTNEAEVERLEQIIEETWREYQAKATPPAQPALASGDEVERLRDALSLALQYLPAQPSGSDAQKDIARIHDLIAGKAAAWDEAHVSEAPSTHGKPDGAVREALDNSQSLLVMINHIGPDREAWKVEELWKLLVEQIAENRTALSPKIAAADDDTEMCIACNTTFVEGDMVYPDASGGCIHVSCCGPEMESYVNADGEPLKEGDPLPTPQRWTSAAAETSPGDVLAIRAAGNVRALIADLQGEHEVMCGPFDASKWKIEVPVADLQILVAAIDRLDVTAQAKSQEPEAVVIVTYTNYRGETSTRRIIPKSVRYGSTEWHPEPQWLLLAWDDDKQADREFALKDFGPTTKPEAPAVSVDAIKDLEDRIQKYVTQLNATGQADVAHLLQRDTSALTSAIAALIAGGR